MLRSDLGQLQEAEELERATLAAQRRVLGDDHDDTILTMSNLAVILQRRGRAAEAELLATEAVERCSRTLGPSHSLCCHVLRKHGQCLIALERYDEAERELLVAHAGLVDALGEDHPDLASTRRALRELYEAWGRPDEAANWQEPAPDAAR
jgi:tetratricopeptide (TPR) repeat protein